MCMRIVSVIGRKDAGKTTLLIALAREFKRQGKRVMTIKHASHPAVLDHEGTDTWRHFHEGSAERTLIASPDIRAVFERSPDDTDPETLARRYLAGADIVLVEGFKRFPIPRIEVHRKSLGHPPLFDEAGTLTKHWIAIVTDNPSLTATTRVIRFQDTMWLPLLAGLTWEHAKVLEP